MDAVRPLCDAVREHGHAELVRQAAEYDGVALESVQVPAAEIQQAAQRLSPEVRQALEESIDRLRETCRAEIPAEVTTEVVSGGTVTQRQVPVGRVGLYAPAAQAPLVSSVVMNVVPAQVAGVGSLALASPAQRDHGGLPHPTILAACALLGVDEVYAAGGAGAIAMFAYGYDHPGGGCRPVDLVTGPANIYGVAAKRLLRGVVGIDSEAGPTEIAVLADDSADPAHVAADLISQAEHDPNAASVLITTSAALADAVDALLPERVGATRHADRVRTALTGPQSGTVLVASLDDAIAVADAYAAEHLEVQTTDAAAVASRVHNAGAIFVGPYSPVSLGDYCAGSNHVLPTSGGARYSAGLNTTTFLKSVQVVEYDRAALTGVAAAIDTLSAAENLPAHGEAVAVRVRP